MQKYSYYGDLCKNIGQVLTIWSRIVQVQMDLAHLAVTGCAVFLNNCSLFRVNFLGEGDEEIGATDLGSPKREFWTTYVQRLLNSHCFEQNAAVSDGETTVGGKLYLRPARSKEEEEAFIYAGFFLGSMIRNSMKHPGRKDLKEVDSLHGRSLESITAHNIADMELAFDTTLPTNTGVETIELEPGKSRIVVNPDNLDEYKQLIISHKLDKSGN